VFSERHVRTVIFLNGLFFGYGFKKGLSNSVVLKDLIEQKHHWVPIYFEPPMMMVAGCLVSITRYVAGSSGCLVLSG